MPALARRLLRPTLVVRRFAAGLMTASLLGSLLAVVPVTPVAGTASATGTKFYVDLTNAVGTGTGCASPDFSAVGSSANQALHDALTGRTDGDVIHICAGTWDVTSQLAPDVNVTLEGDGTTGAGATATILDGTNFGSYQAMIAVAVACVDYDAENDICNEWAGPTSLAATGLTIRKALNGAVRAEDPYEYSASITASNVEFVGNVAQDRGAAIYADGPVSVTNGTFTGNSVIGSYGGGGAIYADSVTVSDSRFVGNHADVYASDGGAIKVGAGTVTVTDSTFVGNSSNRWGGAIESDEPTGGKSTIVGGSFTDNTAGVGGDAEGGAIFVNSTVDIVGTTFTRNRSNGTNGGSGAVRGSVVSATDATFIGNYAAGGALASGGAIGAFTGVKVDNVRFVDNTAATNAGAISSDGYVTITRSTFSRNGAVGQGGAVRALGPVSVVNSTFVENFAGSTGGALYSANSVTATFATFVDNAAPSGATLRASGNLSATGSIFAGGACSVVGSLAVDADNLASSASACSASATTGERLGLAPLALNAPGTTETVAITDGSAAYNAVSSANCTGVTTDQRGVTRPQAGDCDAGAFELAPGAYTVGTGTQDCTAYPTIQEAVDATTGGTIHICGTHDLSTSGPVTTSKALRFVGDGTTGATATVIDGGHLKRLFVGTTDGTLTFENLVLQNGYASTNKEGGAIRALGSVELKNVLVQGNGSINKDGGAIYSAAGSVAVTDGTFIENTAGISIGVNTSGGAIWASVNVTISGGSFLRNRSRDYGGAVLSNTGSISVTNARFEGNWTEQQGGGIDAYSGNVVVSGGRFDANLADEGGAIYADGSVTLTGVDLSANTGISDSGAVAAGGLITVMGGSFTGNAANSGGAITSYNDSVLVRGTHFTDNTAGSGSGGAIKAAKTVAVTDGTFLGNRADTSGGAIRAQDVTISDGTYSGNVAGTWGGVVYATATVTVGGAATFTGNLAGDEGGAIAADGIVASSDSFYTDNTAGVGGAIQALDDMSSLGDTFEGNSATSGDGGAIYGKGVVAISDGTFEGNAAVGDGGAAFGKVFVSITDGTFKGNSGDEGGAICATKDGIVVRGTHFTDNTAATGGAIWADGSAGIVGAHFDGNSATSGAGGAIYASSVSVTGHAAFAKNTSQMGGGAIYATGEIAISNGTFTDNNSALSGGAIRAEGNIAVTDGTFIGNHVPLVYQYGGAVELDGVGSLRVERSFFKGNRAEYGGAVDTSNSQPVAIIDSSFVDNTAGQDGSALWSGAPLSVTGSTFSGNHGLGAGGNGSAVFSTMPASVTNSTFVGNSSAFSGAAIGAQDTLTVRYSTFVDNTAATGGNAIWTDTDVDVVFDHALLVWSGTLCDIGGTPSDSGGSIETGASCLPDPLGTGSRQNVLRDALKLGTFGNNGGPTWTVALSDGSVAIGLTSAPCSVATDQRGVSRAAGVYPGTPCDAGAYENTTGIVIVPVPAKVTTQVSRTTATNVDPFYDTAIVSGTTGDGNGGRIDPTGTVQFYVCYDLSSASNCVYGSTGTWTEVGTPIELSGGTNPADGTSGTVSSDPITGPDGVYVFHASFTSGDPDVYLDAEDAGGPSETVRVAPVTVILAYTGPVIVYTTGDSASVSLTATVSPNIHACPVRFIATSDGTTVADLTAWTAASGTATTTPVRLPLGQYQVEVRTSGPCAGAPDFTGVLSVFPSSLPAGKGGTGGGWYTSDQNPSKVSFGYVVQIGTTTTKVGKATITTTRTKGQLVWVTKANGGWRLKGTVDYSSTDGSTAWGIRTDCDPTTGTALTKCATFAGSGILQQYVGGVWVNPSFGRNVSFVVRAYDGGSASVCKGSGKTKTCSTVEFADYFSITMKAGTRTITTSDGVPVNTLGTLTAWYGLKQGSIKTY